MMRSLKRFLPLLAVIGCLSLGGWMDPHWVVVVSAFQPQPPRGAKRNHQWPSIQWNRESYVPVGMTAEDENRIDDSNDNNKNDPLERTNENNNSNEERQQEESLATTVVGTKMEWNGYAARQTRYSTMLDEPPLSRLLTRRPPPIQVSNNNNNNNNNGLASAASNPMPNGGGSVATAPAATTASMSSSTQTSTSASVSSSTSGTLSSRSAASSSSSPTTPSVADASSSLLDQDDENEDGWKELRKRPFHQQWWTSVTKQWSAVISSSRNNLSANGNRRQEPGTLILVRHGESTWNANKTFTGWSDYADLSDWGTREVEHAARLLLEGGYDIDVVFTSRLQRAIRSVWIILQELNQVYLPVFKSWRLNERMYGKLQGLSKSDTAEQLGHDVVQNWRGSLYA